MMMPQSVSFPTAGQTPRALAERPEVARKTRASRNSVRVAFARARPDAVGERVYNPTSLCASVRKVCFMVSLHYGEATDNFARCLSERRVGVEAERRVCGKAEARECYSPYMKKRPQHTPVRRHCQEFIGRELS